ncbi:CCHC-type domain-containing protein [Aphis craccivora]|uniref:CCHC-type domain-containing protein n=1 Tax=Aphis craccivora TaxID=307492 RepID=A0A6G0WA78_APHCR|nr:CCHC-type domain-containing protein [Aphis craccivora]
MRETRDGRLLLELPTSANSGSAAKTITSTISNKLGDTVGKVLQLGVNVDVEVLDLDAAATAAEVLEALRAAISESEDPATKAEREAIHDVRI